SLNILGGIDFFDVRLFEKVEISPWFWKFKKKKVGIAVSVKYQIATFNDYWCNINEEVFCPDSVWGDILLMEVTEKWEDYKKKIERREKVNQKRLSKGLEPLPLEEIYPRTILLP
ncbi:hypothetical protein L6252_00685, partial [Candidatus Parcubacteria bacterium]|nr:hypothetical protein [Candidatus Parcubacteria bacterium]